jgi:hypothetical protein
MRITTVSLTWAEFEGDLYEILEASLDGVKRLRIYASERETREIERNSSRFEKDSSASRLASKHASLGFYANCGED